MKAYMKELTRKTAVYKEMKASLQFGRDEIGVLSRTQEILKAKLDNVQEFNEELEKARGVQGALGVQADLEQVSSNKADVDNTKGQTLDEISRIVANITTTLKQKKNKLAPQIKELRAIRNKFEEIEAGYLKRKKVHDNIALGLESERVSLEKDVEANTNGILEEESAYHFLNCLSTITQVRLDQMSQELAFQVGDERLNSEHKSYKDMYEKTIQQAETDAKSLRQDKQKVKESHGDHVNQRSMFLDLRKIMECKMRMQAIETKKAEQQENELVFGDQYGERLVIDQ
jgi:intraflagellar transport protein 81